MSPQARKRGRISMECAADRLPPQEQIVPIAAFDWQAEAIKTDMAAS